MDPLSRRKEADSHDFNLGILTTQLRYRWEIAPLTDLFIVYNRGNSINNALSVDAYETPFNDLFSETLEDPIVDTFVAKLRYRFGNVSSYRNGGHMNRNLMSGLGLACWFWSAFYLRRKY